MGIAEILHYLGVLLNRPIAADTPIRLSSAQRARFRSWLHANNTVVQGNKLSSEFAVGQLDWATPVDDRALTAKVPDKVMGEVAIESSGLAVGIDIQAVSELTSNINVNDFKADKSLTGMFTARELSYAQTCASPLETLSGLWAAKEAMRKCIGGRDFPIARLKDLEVLPDSSGRPMCSGFALSISHSGGFALALAVRIKGTIGSGGK